MTKLKIFILSATLLLCISHVQAQWDVPFSRFWTVKTYYNPSFAGETDKIQAAGIYKYRWAGIENAPKSYFLSTDMPLELLGARHGVGAFTYSDAVGDKRNTIFGAQYTFKQKIGKGMLNAGVQAGMYQLDFDAASIRLGIDTTKNNRQVIKANPTDKKTIDINAGISWTVKNFYAGVAARHISQPAFYATGDSLSSTAVKKDSTLSHIPRTYNFLAGGNITILHPLFEIQPMLLVQTNLTDTWLQAALCMVYDKKYSVGAAWRNKDGYSFFAGAVIQDIEVGYAYDLYTSGIGKESGGSHEISVRYSFPVDLFNRKPQPSKSVRLL